MIKIILLLIIGGVGGYLTHCITMKISFKRRTIDNKIKVYDSIIAHWVRMRNFIFSAPNKKPHSIHGFDKIYGESQTFIGEAILICEETQLTEDINNLNEKIYRTDWDNLADKEVNTQIEAIKKNAIEIIARMREDIKNCTRLDRNDLVHIWKGLLKKSKN